jgi:hypothetical protein
MAGFYSGATGTTPPLHWPTIAPELTVELCLGKIRRRLAQDLLGLAQLTVLGLKRLQAFAFVGGEAGALAGVTFGLLHPVRQRLRRATDLAGDRGDGGRLRRVVAGIVSTMRTARSRTSVEYFGDVLF